MNLNIISDNLLNAKNGNPGWFIIGMIIFLLVSLILTGLTTYFKGKKIALIQGFILGIIGVSLFATIRYFIPIDKTQIDIADKWTNLPGKIFTDLIMTVIPLYVFVMIVLLFIDKSNNKINKKTYAVSFLSLLGMSLFGIAIALFMIPLILLIPDNLKNFNPGENESIEWIKILRNYSILIFILLGVITGTTLKIAGKHKPKVDENSFIYFSNFKKYLFKYLQIIIYLVPFVIITTLTKFSLIELEKGKDIFLITIIYFGLYSFGSIIIFLSLLFINSLVSHSSETFKEKISLLLSHSLYVFGTQSTSASLPRTQEVARSLGVSQDISNLTPTKGIVMGMVMCNGFTPTLIILMSLNNYNNLTFLYVLLSVLLIFFLVISSSGAGSADYTITITTLGILNISNLFYLSTIMPIQEINETLIAKPNNVYGHILASQITEKVNIKTSTRK